MERGFGENNKIALFFADKENKKKIVKLITYGGILILWQVLATAIDIPLVLPKPASIVVEFINSLRDLRVLENLSITLSRVIRGWLLAVVIGVPVGIAMGLSPIFDSVAGGIVNSMRQVPMMAWVPLSITWLGIGDGPTLFMIALNGVFQIILNTSSGVADISDDYYYAARSMGANKLSIFKNIVIPAAMPNILTGVRLALGSGWMSVMWAEFIATSAGLGYEIQEAQQMMRTDRLIALMVISAVIGVLLDQILQFLNRRLTKWRYV